MAQTLNVQPADLADVLDLLDLAGSAKADTTLGAATMAELCRDTLAFSVDADGERLAAYAIKVVNHENERVAWVMAAGGGMRGVDLTATVLPAIEYQAQQLNAGQIAITTRRRGLIHKLSAMGYTVAGITLRKNIK